MATGARVESPRRGDDLAFPSFYPEGIDVSARAATGSPADDERARWERTRVYIKAQE